jgi:endonuclease III
VSLSTVVDALRQFYGRLPDPPNDPFAYFVWEVLAAESAPLKRDAAFLALKKIPALTPDAMHRAPPAKIATAVALAGPYRERRLEALMTGIDRFRRTRDLPRTLRGPLRAARRALRPIPALGTSGAWRLLLFAANRPVLPVETKVERVASRIGYGSESADPRLRARTIRKKLAGELQGDLETIRRTVLYLSHHGSVTCLEREPHCGVCPLARDCAFNSSRRDAGAVS